MDRSVALTYKPLAKDLRALDPSFIKSALGGWSVPADVEIAGAEVLEALAKSDTQIIMPDEDISHELASKYFAGHEIEYSPVFLRWDRRRSEAEEQVGVGQSVSSKPRDIALMERANKEGWSSSDIWRRVGALIVKDDKVLLHGYNKALPTDVTPWAEGDPRNNFGKGVAIDMSLFIHAEAGLIAEAARTGLVLEGSSMYVTTFPCPACAKLIAQSGIASCYFSKGYAMLDGERVLEASGVEIIKVEGNLADPPEEVWVPYPQDT